MLFYDPASGIPEAELGHTPFQIDHFILRRGNWTPWGEYRQCVREIRRRRRGVVQLDDEIHAVLLDLADARGTWCFRERSRARRTIRVRGLLEKVRELERAQSNERRELAHFEARARALRAELGELSQQRREDLEREAWLVRIRIMVASDLARTHTVANETLMHVLCLDPPERTAIFRDMEETLVALREQRPAPLLGWLETYDAPRLPSPDDLARRCA